MGDLKSVKAVFFDLGDTLIDSKVFGPRGELKAVEKVIELNELDKQPCEYLPLVEQAGRVSSKLIEQGRHPGESLQEFGERVIKAKYAKLIDLMGGKSEEGNVELVFKALLDGIATADSLFPETEEVLKTLKELYRLGLLSNNIVEYARGPLKHLGLERFFDVVVISGEENVRKPESEIFYRALERIGVDPPEAMMVGDSAVEDIQGARSVGITAVWINRLGEESGSASKADLIIKDLRELLEVL